MTGNKKQPKSGADRLTEAQSLLAQGKPGKANAIFEEILAKDPNNVALIADIARQFQMAGRPGFAVKKWKLVSELQPRAEVFELMGDLYDSMEKRYRAMVAYRSAVEKFPSEPRYVNKFYEALRKTPVKFILQESEEVRTVIELCLIDGNVGHKRVMPSWVLLLLHGLEHITSLL